MKLWMLTVRPLGITSEQRRTSVLRVACNATTELDLMMYLYTHKFSREWWAEHIVLDIDGFYDIWHVQPTEQAAERPWNELSARQEQNL